MAGLESAGDRGAAPPGALTDIAMRPLLDRSEDDSGSTSDESHDSAQAGVKRLEAISSTWSKSGLYIAYMGCVSLRLLLESANELAASP